MTAVATIPWHDANQQYLMAALDRIRTALERRISEPQAEPAIAAQSLPALESATTALPAPAALTQLGTLFGLSPFERDLLLLCAGPELDASLPTLYATVQGDSQRPYPTFSLALSVLPSPHWSAITPKAPLRRWRLIEIGAGRSLTLSPLRIDERILHYITGLHHLDERLVSLIKPLRAHSDLVPSHQALAQQLGKTWSVANHAAALPVIQLCGTELAGKRAIAIAACAQVGLKLHVLPVHALPTTASDLHDLMLLWEREAALSASALLLDCDEWDTDALKEGAIAQLIESIASPLIVTSRDRRRTYQRPLVTFDVPPPNSEEQRLLWYNGLGDRAHALNGQVDALVSQFSLNAPTIQSVCAEALGHSTESAIATLWDTCRIQARPRLDELAQRIESGSTWDDLILPDAQRQTLRDIAAHVQQRARVYEQWGFGAKGGRGLGISALFAGVSGTGKTMAADVLAQELRLDLYRIDLSSVVSKYIGETEKNLRRVFDAAEAGGVILLFDEADALFGKRSEVKDSHDRYANMEVSYLLQRMESYRGLAILTTNLKDSIDTAFLRRIRFVVKFPFPDAAQRAEIWRRVFPSATPTDGLDATKLACLNVAGGNIRNIALNAAFIAAAANEPVRMSHILAAARSEYIKLERSLTDAEVKGWV